MNRMILILPLILLINCFPSFDIEQEKLFIKEIYLKDIKLEWFFYSNFSNTTSDYILIYSNNRCDTICIADNISNVYIFDDTININLYNKTKRENKEIYIINEINNYSIKIDTNGIDKLHHNKYYKK